MAKFTCMKVRVESFVIQLGNEGEVERAYVELRDVPSGVLHPFSSLINEGLHNTPVSAVDTNRIYYLMYNGADVQKAAEAVEVAAAANPKRIYLRKARQEENPSYFIKLMESQEKTSDLCFHCLTCKKDWIVPNENGQGESPADIRECPNCHISGFGCEFIGILNETGGSVSGEPFPMENPPNAFICDVKMP